MAKTKAPKGPITDGLFFLDESKNKPQHYQHQPAPSSQRDVIPPRVVGMGRAGSSHRTTRSASPHSSKPMPDNNLELINRLNQFYQIARDHKRTRYDTWVRNYRLVNNRIGGTSSQAWMPNPRDSEIYPVLSSLVAWMTDQNTTIDFVPAVDPYSSYYSMMGELSNDLSDVVYAAWLIYNYDAQIKLSLWDEFQYGCGIMKSVWDGSLAGGKGDINLRRVDPWAFYPDPHATSFDDMEYCVEVHRMSYDEIERRFGPEKARQLPSGGAGSLSNLDERPTLFSDVSHSPRANPGPLPGGQVRYGQAKSTGQYYDPFPVYIVYETWMRQNNNRSTSYDVQGQVFTESYVESDWRVVMHCGNVTLLDESASDLWDYGCHPYDRNTFDDTGEFWGIALVDHLAFPQIYINRLLTAMQQNAELTGNPILVESEASGSSRTNIFNRPGQRIPVRGAGGLQMNKPEWLDPPSMPPAIMDLTRFWIERIQNTAGFSAINGNMPNQRNSTDVINAVQEAAFVRIRAAQNNLEYMLQSAAAKLGGLVVDNYTETRYIAVLGPDGQPASKYLLGRHFKVPGKNGSEPLSFSVQVRAGSSAPTSRQARISEAEHLFALGAVDDEFVLGVHQIRHPQEVLQRLYQKRTAGLIGTPGQRQRSGRSS